MEYIGRMPLRQRMGRYVGLAATSLLLLGCAELLHNKADSMLSDDKTEAATPEGYGQTQTDVFVDIPNNLAASISQEVGKAYETAGDLAGDAGTALALTSLVAVMGEALPSRPYTTGSIDG